MSFDDLKLRTKITIPLFLLGFTICAMAAYGGTKLFAVSTTASELIDQKSRAALWLARARSDVIAMGYNLFDKIIFAGSDKADAAQQSIPHFIESASARLEEAKALAPERAEAIGKFKDRLTAMADGVQAAAKIGTADKGAAAAVDAQLRSLEGDLKTAMVQMQDENAKAADALHAESSAALWTLGGGGLTVAALVLALSQWIASAKIVRPLQRLGSTMSAISSGDAHVAVEGAARRDEVGDMSRALEVFKRNLIERQRIEQEAAAQRSSAEAERERAAAERAKAAAELSEAVERLGDGLKKMAEGDLGSRLNNGFTAQYAQLRDDFNEAIGKLKGAVANVIESSIAIGAHAKEVSGAADDLSRRTEAQASSLEQTAASLQEVSETVRTSAEGTRQARVLVTEADNDAQKSAGIVSRAVDAMNGIAKSSQEISKIIGVIDEIAFQTNLLALNAGVEAARAGEAARGFAVVASEVRALAQRSAEAAKEIKTLISASDGEVQTGVELVAQTGDALRRIATKVSEISAVVTGIATGAEQQAASLQEVNSAISQMSATTQANAAMVEESSAAGRALAQESVRLTKLVEQFRIEERQDRKWANAA